MLCSLPLPLSGWAVHAAKGVAEYTKLREEHCPDPRQAAEDPDVDLSISNPLSQHSASPWQNFFEDSELRHEMLTNPVMALRLKLDKLEAPAAEGGPAASPRARRTR